MLARLALALAVLSGPAFADDIQVQSQRLTDPAGPKKWERFGESSAIDGDRAAIARGPGGSVFTYRWNGTQWTQEAEIANPVGPYNEFGAGLALDGDHLAIGAPGADLGSTDVGAVFVYHWDGATWHQEGLLLAPDGAQYDGLGRAVALQGGHLLAGAPRHRLVGKPGMNQGAAYAWRWNGAAWTFTNKLVEPTPHYEDWFGWDLDIDGTTAVVAELPGGQDYFGSSHRGESHVFAFDGQRWVHEAEHKAPQADSRWYGGSIALEGGRYVVYDYDYGVWVFEGAGANWTQTALLVPDAQGTIMPHVALDGGRVAFGAWRDPLHGVFSNEIYLYEQVGGVWTKARELHLADPDEDVVRLVAFDGDLALGYGHGPEDLESSGVAYAWDTSTPAIGTSYCPADPHHDGGPGHLSAFGSVSVAAGMLNLAATQLTYNQLGIFLMSQSPDSSPLGTGTLCVGAPLFRFSADQVDTGENAALGVTLDFANLPQGQAFLPGATWYFQCWFRLHASSTLTDAVAITWQ